MSVDLNYIKINGTSIPRPPEFKPQREDVYAGEYMTCTGKLIADKIGWKFADMTMKWDALPQSQVDALIAMTGENTMIFDDPGSDEHTETVIRDGIVSLRYRFTMNNSVWWRDVEVGVKFINVHND